MNNEIRYDLINKIYEKLQTLQFNEIYDSMSIDNHELIAVIDGVEIQYVPDYYYVDIIGLSHPEFNTLEQMIQDQNKREQILEAQRAERKRKALINLYYMLHPDEWTGENEIEEVK